MLLIGLGICFCAAGFFLYFFTCLFPILRVAFLDWIALVLFVLPYGITMYRLHVTKAYKQADTVPKWKHLINYMRRDNEIVPVIGERAYPGESFIDVDKLGLIEFLGKDCVYTWGDKKVIWGLENINFTPDPRYFNLTHLLWELGFHDSDDIKNVLSGKDLYLMGRVNLNMDSYGSRHGANRLVSDMKNYDGKKVRFKGVSGGKRIRFRVPDKYKKVNSEPVSEYVPVSEPGSVVKAERFVEDDVDRGKDIRGKVDDLLGGD